MRTRYIPAGVMLLAGAVTCIISIVQKQDIIKSLITLLTVLILFYVIGLVAKFFIEKILKEFKDKEANKASEDIDEGDLNNEDNPESSDVENSLNTSDKNRL